ncbi:conserved glutamic acid rich protein [Ophiocordyceps camponoti-floridani]|uniref:Conserved glutamic acid rich protein n=1 Tax=Ophiocordyceps camponoti-floridani TaxID=2030778 RepID=A0A8H4VGK0_9HYPO|nr:conserved glutamic acid rich protein [Ophiocordyceps camponoti-floridani]
MAHRSSRMTDFEERDYYAAPRRPAADLDDRDYRPRAGPRSRVATSEYDEVDVRLRDRELDRTPGFLRDEGRRPEAGPMVLRQRDIETIDRHARSPSPPPVRRREMVRRPKSTSPPTMRGSEHENIHTRIVERERDRVRSPSVVRCRSPSPLPVRFVERRRRSPSPVSQHDHIRIVERERQRVPSPSPSPSPPPAPAIIRGPTIERDVITHWTDVDHGVVRAKPPSPRARSRPRERETDIDISLSKDRTEVDIHQSNSRPRSKSRERRSRFHEDDVVVRRDGNRLRVDEYSGPRRRAQSAAPLCSPAEEEAEYLTSKIDTRGRMGEAWGGVTKDWCIVDVPPGTERVRMDGVGGASTDTTWSRYSGVRRTQFNSERDGVLVPREPSPAPSRDRASAYDREREIDVDIDRRVTRTPLPPPQPPAPAKELWTEITKDLIVREAIEQQGYEYEETKCFFYIMDYLRFEDVLRLTELSKSIRRARKERAREIEWERDWRDEWERPFRRPMHDHHDHHRSREEWDDERVREREFVYDSRRPNRGYLR